MTTSTKKSYPLYSEQLETVLAVTRMLNKNGEDINFGDMYRLKVQLVENAGNSVIGEWSDEIAVTDWEFAIVHEEEKPKFNPHVTRLPNGSITNPREGFQPVNHNRGLGEPKTDVSARAIPGGYVVND